VHGESSQDLSRGHPLPEKTAAQKMYFSIKNKIACVQYRKTTIQGTLFFVFFVNFSSSIHRRTMKVMPLDTSK
jgi:hypothetical protein